MSVNFTHCILNIGDLGNTNYCTWTDLLDCNKIVFITLHLTLSCWGYCYTPAFCICIRYLVLVPTCSQSISGTCWQGVTAGRGFLVVALTFRDFGSAPNDSHGCHLNRNNLDLALWACNFGRLGKGGFTPLLLFLYLKLIWGLLQLLTHIKTLRLP